MLVKLAAVVAGQQEWIEVQRLLEEGFPLLEELGDRPDLASALELMAAMAVADRQPERAARLYGAAHELRESLRVPLPASERSRYDHDLTRLREALGEKR